MAVFRGTNDGDWLGEESERQGFNGLLNATIATTMGPLLRFLQSTQCKWKNATSLKIVGMRGKMVLRSLSQWVRVEKRQNID